MKISHRLRFFSSLRSSSEAGVLHSLPQKRTLLEMNTAFFKNPAWVEIQRLIPNLQVGEFPQFTHLENLTIQNIQIVLKLLKQLYTPRERLVITRTYFEQVKVDHHYIQIEKWVEFCNRALIELQKKEPQSNPYKQAYHILSPSLNRLADSRQAQKFLRKLEERSRDLETSSTHLQNPEWTDAKQLMPSLQEGEFPELDDLQKIHYSTRREVFPVLAQLYPPRERLSIAARYLQKLNTEDYVQIKEWIVFCHKALKELEECPESRLDKHEETLYILGPVLSRFENSLPALSFHGTLAFLSLDYKKSQELLEAYFKKVELMNENVNHIHAVTYSKAAFRDPNLSPIEKLDKLIMAYELIQDPKIKMPGEKTASKILAALKLISHCFYILENPSSSVSDQIILETLRTHLPSFRKLAPYTNHQNKNKRLIHLLTEKTRDLPEHVPQRTKMALKEVMIQALPKKTGQS